MKKTNACIRQGEISSADGIPPLSTISCLHVIAVAVAMVFTPCMGETARMDACGGSRVSIVQDVPGYNSWPMIQTVGGRLVCAYSRGSAHTIGEGARGVYSRTSTDGGKT